MLFNSAEFLLVFLPATLALYYLARRALGHWAALAVLNLASLIYYGWWEPAYLPLILGSALGNLALGRWIAAGGGRLATGLGVAANLALLGVYKYADFAIANLNALPGVALPLPGMELPLAISFFTFQQIAFLVEVARGQTAPARPDRHLLFVAFFPQLIAGPIVDHRRMAPQLADAGRRDDIAENLAVGLSMFAFGLGKKVLLADNLAPLAASAFEAAERGQAVGLSEAWLGALAYSLQIFFDFSGYSDMALGLGRAFGFRLPVNFNAPYRARSVVDFWRRWHITLSQFLRDYLYIPLGGGRRGPVRRAANLMIVMLLGGLWHGAAWTFVVWGGLHGLALVVNHLWERAFPKGLFGRFHIAPRLLTFLFVTLAWVFFRAEGFSTAETMFAGLAGLAGPGPTIEVGAVALVALGLALVWGLPDTPSLFLRWLDPATIADARLEPQPGPRWRPGPIAAGMAATLLFLCVINGWRTAEFIYYTF